MKRIGLTLLALALLAGCGGDEEGAGGLSADEQQRLENIAARLDEESGAVRESLQADGNALDSEATEGSTSE